jgi:hypothetical protein
MSEASHPTKKRLRGLGIAVTLLFIAAVITVALRNLPKGIDMDLTKIGAGKPALVFVYDSNLSVSGAQTEAINQMRDGFDEAVNFLVADVGRPQAQDWLRQHQARAAELFFFDGEGVLRHRQSALLSADELTDALRARLNIQK